MVNPCSTAAHRPMGPRVARAHDLKARAHAHGSPTVLLRVCLRSNLRREPGRWPGVSRALRQSQLRFADSGPHSPPRWRTRGRRCDLSLPFARKERFRDLSGRPTAPGPGISSGNFSLTGLSLRLRRQDTRTETFLRNLLTIARNRGGVNAFCPTPLFFPNSS